MEYERLFTGSWLRLVNEGGNGRGILFNRMKNMVFVVVTLLVRLVC